MSLCAGARQLGNLTNTLLSCQANIHSACRPSDLPQVNQTFMSECDSLVGQFQTGVQDCLDRIIGVSTINLADVCTCWTSPSLDKVVQSVKICKVTIN